MITKTANISYLESTVDATAGSLGVKPATWQEFKDKLAALKEHNLSTYMHSLRVGIYSYGISKLENQSDLKFPLFAGCGHDIGKCEIDNTVLDTKVMTTEQFEDIKRHTTEGFELLKDSFLYSGYVAGLHHKYQANDYGIDLDVDSPIALNPKARKKIILMAKQVMIADFFDALTTRNNDKGLIKDRDDKSEIRTILKKYFPGSAKRIDWLILNKI
jgi:HD-GYP domain-containing protein (c-di-GMP phosphodiesterase class II)